MKRARVFAAAALPVAALVTAMLGQGCASKCGANCPATEVTVIASSGENLDWTVSLDGGVGTNWTGPACPLYPPSCRGDEVNNCQRFDILPSGPGVCDFTLIFSTTSKRDPFYVHTEFGSATTMGCCQGFPALTPTLVTVPPLGSPPQDAGLEAPPPSATDASDDGAEGGAVDAPLD
jgi:hypothetical protein